MKLYVNMPAGDFYGWGICGKNMIRELSKLTDVRYVPDSQYDNAIRDYNTDKMVKEITEKPNGEAFNFLQAINNSDIKLNHKGKKNIGYIFFEDDSIPEKQLEGLKEFDVVATGSDWNTDILKGYGINAHTVHQGVDCDIFKPMPKTFFNDKFVIFSGGKLEHRKAQDIVAEAVGYMQHKYHDVFLITSWNNVFADEKAFADNMDLLKSKLVPNQTIMTGFLKHDELVKFIAESDIGFFPNRYEGGTNLVMMEYMACGKPVVANYATGQKDVLAHSNSYFSFLSGEMSEKQLIDYYIGELEYAYNNRDDVKQKGLESRKAMQKFTWENTAKNMLNLFKEEL